MMKRSKPEAPSSAAPRASLVLTLDQASRLLRLVKQDGLGMSPANFTVSGKRLMESTLEAMIKALEAVSTPEPAPKRETKRFIRGGTSKPVDPKE